MDSDKPSVKPLEGVRNAYVISGENDEQLLELARRLRASGSVEASAIFDNKEEAVAYAVSMEAKVAAANIDTKDSQAKTAATQSPATKDSPAKSTTTQAPVPKATDA